VWYVTRPGGQYVRITGPIRLLLGTAPHRRESQESARLSPSMKYSPCGTRQDRHVLALPAAGAALAAGEEQFVEAYRIAARCVLVLERGPLGEKELVKKALALGNEMFLAGVGAKDDPNSGGRQIRSFQVASTQPMDAICKQYHKRPMKWVCKF